MFPASIAPSEAPAPTDRVQLVDEQQDATLGHLHLAQDRLQTLLELAPVLRAGDQRRHVECEHRLVAQALGHVAMVDPLGEPLDNRCFSHAGLTHEDGVVLGLAGEDLDRPPDLAVAADDRFQSAGCGVQHQVPSVLLERFVRDLGHRGRDPLVAADLGQRRQEAVAREPLAVQQTTGGRGCPFFQQGDHQVLHRDVLVLESAWLPCQRCRTAGTAAG
jgi:hypothetical protein